MVNAKKKRKEEWLQKRKEWEDGIKDRYCSAVYLLACKLIIHSGRERKKNFLRIRRNGTNKRSENWDGSFSLVDSSLMISRKKVHILVALQFNQQN